MIAVCGIRASLRIVIAFAAVLNGCAGTDDAYDPVVEGRLVLEQTIGQLGADAPDDYSFATIFAFLVTRSGDVWVIDGVWTGEGQAGSRVRLFSPSGTLRGSVGREGDGPGEYRNPSGLAELPDGRIALRSGAVGGKILIFDRDGRVDTTWSVPYTPGSSGTRGFGGNDLRADSSGVLWLAVVRSREFGRRLWYQRMSPGGALIDSIHLPAPHSFPPDIPLIGAECNQNWGANIQYMPGGFVSRIGGDGLFATGRTDIYRLELYDAAKPGVRDGTPLYTPEAIIERKVAPVAIPDAERQTMRETANESQRIRPDGCRMLIPEMPRIKPPIRSVSFATNGARLLVHLSTPSVRKDGYWTEQRVVDVFERDGRYVGTLPLPDEIGNPVVTGDTVWALYGDEAGTAVLRRYRIEWR